MASQLDLVTRLVGQCVGETQLSAHARLMETCTAPQLCLVDIRSADAPAGAAKGGLCPVRAAASIYSGRMASQLDLVTRLVGQCVGETQPSAHARLMGTCNVPQLCLVDIRSAGDCP